MTQFGIARTARSRRADAEGLTTRLVKLAPRLWPAAAPKPSRGGVTLALHSIAPRARLRVTPDGALELAAATACVGPAYHADVAARVAPVAAELGLAWDDDDDGDVEAEMCAWIADELRAGATRVAMPSPRVFHVPGAVQTSLGPRDAAWIASVLAEPAHAVDTLAWRTDEPGHAARAHALLAMWHELPWRAPIDDDERDAMDRIDSELRAAHHADPRLALPWAAWAELLAHLGSDDDAHAAAIRARAATAPPAPPIGYRRFELDVELPGGWSIRLPGAFVGAWDDEHGRYYAGDGRRAIEVTTMTATGELDSARLLAVAPEAFPVIARHAGGDLVGRAEREDRGAQIVVHALMACAPHVALVTLRGAPADEAWALATWRSLART